MAFYQLVKKTRQLTEPLFQRAQEATWDYGRRQANSVVGQAVQGVVSGLMGNAQGVNQHFNQFVQAGKRELPDFAKAYSEGMTVGSLGPEKELATTTAKLAPRFVKTAKGMADRLANELQTYIRPGALSHNNAILEQIGRLSHSTPEELPVIIKEVQGMIDNYSQKVSSIPAKPLADRTVEKLKDFYKDNPTGKMIKVQAHERAGIPVSEYQRLSKPLPKEVGGLDPRKYKSAEEMYQNYGGIKDNYDWKYLDDMRANKAKGKPISQGDFNALSRLEPELRGKESRTFYRAGGLVTEDGNIWLTPQEHGAIQYADAGGTKVREFKVGTKNPLVLENMEKIEKILGKLDRSEEFTNNPELKNKVIEYAKKNGYDSVLMPDSFPDGYSGMQSLVVWDKNLVKTKSQIKEMWLKSSPYEKLKK